jgi:hypothetical protein
VKSRFRNGVLLVTELLYDPFVNLAGFGVSQASVRIGHADQGFRGHGAWHTRLRSNPSIVLNGGLQITIDGLLLDGSLKLYLWILREHRRGKHHRYHRNSKKHLSHVTSEAGTADCPA